MLKCVEFIQQGKTGDAYREMKENGISCDNVLEYGIFNRLGGSFFLVLARMVVEHDPAQCNRLYHFRDNHASYKATWVQLLLWSRPSLELFEMVVSHTSTAVLCAPDDWQSTVLRQIVASGYDACYVRVLLHYGADPTTLDAQSRLPIDYARSESVADALLSYGSGAGSGVIGKRVHRKRYACTKARFALGVCLLKKCMWVQKDVIRSIILPQVYEMRLDNAWFK